MLTEKQKVFCREYVIDFNVLQAMQRAGYSYNTANRHGYAYRNRPEIAFEIKNLMEKQFTKHELSAEFVLEELRRIAASNIADYYKWSEKKKKYVLKPFSELTKEQTAAIAEYKPGERYKLYNKDPALDKLAKYFKLYSEVESVVTNFVMMPEVKMNGVPLEFNIGKPVPKRPTPKKN